MSPIRLNCAAGASQRFQCERRAENATEMAQFLDADICAVKFPEYMTDGPGYYGELYLLMGGDLGTPLMLIRKNGELKISQSAE